MLTNRWIYPAVWLVAAAALWTFSVPAAMSRSTFAWMNVVVFLLLVFLSVIWRGTRPTTSITQILYDIEHKREAQR